MVISIMEENENSTGDCEEMQEEAAALVCNVSMHLFSGNHNQVQQSTHVADVTTEETIGLALGEEEPEINKCQAGTPLCTYHFHRCRTKLESITSTAGNMGIW